MFDDRAQQDAGAGLLPLLVSLMDPARPLEQAQRNVDGRRRHPDREQLDVIVGDVRLAFDEMTGRIVTLGRPDGGLR